MYVNMKPVRQPSQEYLFQNFKSKTGTFRFFDGFAKDTVGRRNLPPDHAFGFEQQNLRVQCCYLIFHWFTTKKNPASSL